MTNQHHAIRQGLDDLQFDVCNCMWQKDVSNVCDMSSTSRQFLVFCLFSEQINFILDIFHALSKLSKSSDSPVLSNIMTVYYLARINIMYSIWAYILATWPEIDLLLYFTTLGFSLA